MPISSQGVKMKYRYWNSYKVYENGDVCSPNGKSISFCSNQKGYRMSKLKFSDGKWRTITHHNVVAQAWFGEKPDGYEVDHINNIRSDNRVANLRYLTRTDNRIKSYREGFRNVEGGRNANAKYTGSIESLCTLLDSENDSGDQILICSRVSRSTGVPVGVVRNVWNGKQWRSVSNKYNFSSRFRD